MSIQEKWTEYESNCRWRARKALAGGLGYALTFAGAALLTTLGAMQLATTTSHFFNLSKVGVSILTGSSAAALIVMTIALKYIPKLGKNDPFSGEWHGKDLWLRDHNGDTLVVKESKTDQLHYTKTGCVTSLVYDDKEPRAVMIGSDFNPSSWKDFMIKNRFDDKS